MKKIIADQITEPFLPKATYVEQQIDMPAKEPSSPELRAWLETYDNYASAKAHSEPLPTLGGHQIRERAFRDVIDKVGWSAWLDDLYIPGLADSRLYWPTTCPPDHRYTQGWFGGPGSENNAGDPATGHISAYASARPSDVLLKSEAGVGFDFKPRRTLAVYTIQPSITALGNYRWDTGIPGDFGGTIRLRGYVYTVAYLISPVDGSLSLISPYGLSMAFDHSFNNQGAIPVTPVHPPWPPGPAPTNVMLEGGRTYRIAVIATAQVDNGWTDGQGHPIPSLPPQAIWRVWCALDCTVNSISVDLATVYIH